MNVATSTRGVDVICLNDKGESLAEGEPHQSHARITLRRRWESSRTHALMLMDKHSNSNVGVINYCQHSRGTARTGSAQILFARQNSSDVNLIGPQGENECRIRVSTARLRHATPAYEGAAVDMKPIHNCKRMMRP